MNYRDWFERCGIDINTGVYVTAASDGLKIGRDKIMAVSVMGPQEHQRLGTVYIRGAAAERAKEYTGVDLKYYVDNAVGIDRARELLAPALVDCRFLVVYTGKKYTIPWLLDGGLLMLTQFPYLDVVDMVRHIENGRPVPADTLTIQDLQLRFSDLDHLRGGFSVDALCQRYACGYDGDRDDHVVNGSRPELERKVFKLQRIWETVIQIGK